MKLIDLHTHTTCSDGTLTPAELVREAAAKGLAAVAITDHDCVDGVEEAMREAERAGMEIIPALEISAEFGRGTMHLLGYFIDWRLPPFLQKLRRLQKGRRERNPKIVQKLRELGCDVTYEEVAAVSGGGQIGRPHFARVLVQKGYVRSIQDAFDRYLKKGAPAYVDKERFSPQEAIALIHQAGGVAVLAHPATLGLSPSEIPSLLKGLADTGLDGVEVFYSLHTGSDVAFYLPLVESFGLVATGGSDFHGANKPGIEIGVGKGNLRVNAELLTPLKERRRRGATG